MLLNIDPVARCDEFLSLGQSWAESIRRFSIPGKAIAFSVFVAFFAIAMRETCILRVQEYHFHHNDYWGVIFLGIVVHQSDFS